jgi:hypothetical protein
MRMRKNKMISMLWVTTRPVRKIYNKKNNNKSIRIMISMPRKITLIWNKIHRRKIIKRIYKVNSIKKSMMLNFSIPQTINKKSNNKVNIKPNKMMDLSKLKKTSNLSISVSSAYKYNKPSPSS